MGFPFKWVLSSFLQKTTFWPNKKSSVFTLSESIWRKLISAFLLESRLAPFSLSLCLSLTLSFSVSHSLFLCLSLISPSFSYSFSIPLIQRHSHSRCNQYFFGSQQEKEAKKPLKAAASVQMRKTFRSPFYFDAQSLQGWLHDCSLKNNRSLRQPTWKVALICAIKDDLWSAFYIVSLKLGDEAICTFQVWDIRRLLFVKKYKFDCWHRTHDLLATRQHCKPLPRPQPLPGFVKCYPIKIEQIFLSIYWTFFLLQG